MVKFTSPKTSTSNIVLYTDHVRVVSKCRNYVTTSHKEVKVYD